MTLDGIAPAAGLVLVTPHDPLVLLEQLQQRRTRSRSSTCSAVPMTGRLSLTRKVA